MHIYRYLPLPGHLFYVKKKAFSKWHLQPLFSLFNYILAEVLENSNFWFSGYIKRVPKIANPVENLGSGSRPEGSTINFRQLFLWKRETSVGRHAVVAYARASPRSSRTKNIRGSRFKTFQRGRVIIAGRRTANLMRSLLPSSRLRCCYRRCRWPRCVRRRETIEAIIPTNWGARRRN